MLQIPSEFPSNRPSAHATPTLAARFRNAIQQLGRVGLLAACWTMHGGCTRQQYRCKTDNEVYHILDEKRAQSCEQGAAQIRIELDPRSRMFDPFNPDRPPMPEDDPQANRLMRCVDKKAGYPLWEANGRTNITENPEWWQSLPLDERGVLVIDLDDAVRIALLHSPEYQQNLETMYLSALDVSIERFLLDSQFFAGTGSNYTVRGATRGDDLLRLGTGSASVQKLFTTGATLVAEAANSFTWNVGGTPAFTSPSLVSFTFIQPLLRGGGRDVVLERLTLAERALLSNVRAFERYRRGFYVEIATGTGAGISPSRQGGAFGGAGLGGFDALGSVFQNAGNFGGGGGGAAVQNANGYIGILQDQLNIDNQRENILRLQDIYLQYEDAYRELLLTMPENQTQIPSQQLQVAQAQQSVYQAQSVLLQRQTAYESTLDGFKQTLGLPPYLCIDVKGNLLDRFKLISQDLRDRRTRMANYRANVGNQNSRLLALSSTSQDAATGVTYRTLEASQEAQRTLATLADELQPIRGMVDEILEFDVAEVENDIAVLRQAVPVRRKQLDRLKRIAQEERGMVCSLLPLGDFSTSFLDREGLEELPDALTDELVALVEKIESQADEFGTLQEKILETSQGLDDFSTGRQRFESISEDLILGTQDLIASLNEDILGLQLIQARARTEAVSLPEIDLEVRDAVEIARQNRRDWLIRKTSLVDTWRRIELVADNLESILNLTLGGDIGNIGKNPFAFNNDNASLGIGMSWDAPITRIQERNNYRQILIQYQQARRGYYQFEDGIWRSLRTTLRSIRQSQLAFEIQRFAVQNAALQISVNEDIRLINETLGQSSGPTAARDAVQGLNAFLDAQSQLIGLFSTFESARRVLDRDLGTMQIDGEGLWIDPGPLTLETVGGGLGQAIADCGLTEGEQLLPSRTQIVEPLEIVPTDEMPPMPVSGDQLLKTPVKEAPGSPNLSNHGKHSLGLQNGNVRLASFNTDGPQNHPRQDQSTIQKTSANSIIGPAEPWRPLTKNSILNSLKTRQD